MRHRASYALLFGLLFCFPADAFGQAAPPASLKAVNDELASVWARLGPVLSQKLHADLSSQLASLQTKQGKVEVQVRKVRSLKLVFDPPPGFQSLSSTRVELGVPVAGEWKVEASLDVRVKTKILFVKVTLDVPATVTVDRVRMVGTADIDQTDPTRPLFKTILAPDVKFRLRLRSKNLIYNILFTLLSPVADKFAHKALGDALKQLAPALATYAGGPGPVPGDGTPQLQDSGVPTPFADVVRNVDVKLRRDHLPHGTLLEAEMDTPQTDSWEVAYGTGGPGNLGNVVRRGASGDSAIWTGHYLASQAFRYNVTQEPEALQNVQHALAGVGALLDVNGGTGLLARVAAPASSPEGQEILQRGVFGQAQIGGQLWVGRQGDGGISRDQYSGAFFGLIITYDLVSDATVKAECARRIRQMLDYVIAHDWFIDEDRPAFTAGLGSGFPTFWFGIVDQKLAFIHMGNRVSGGAYAAELAKAGPLAATAWFGSWLSTFNPESYYKFNLSHTAFYNYFRLETDLARWQEMDRARRIQERYVGHHKNPHFNLIHASIDPSLRATRHPAVREAIRQFLQRNHRQVAPASLDLSGIVWHTYTYTDYDIQTMQPVTRQVTMPKEPLDIPLRKYEGFFLWQRTPFSPATPGAGNANHEKPGIDLVLPYWMGRHHGAF